MSIEEFKRAVCAECSTICEENARMMSMFSAREPDRLAGRAFVCAIGDSVVRTHDYSTIALQAIDLESIRAVGLDAAGLIKALVDSCDYAKQVPIVFFIESTHLRSLGHCGEFSVNVLMPLKSVDGLHTECCAKGCAKRTPGASAACSACGLVVYCSKQCQRADWPAHKRACMLNRRMRSGNSGGLDEIIEKASR